MIPAIVVTGFADPVLEAEARNLGGVFVVKPIAPRDLLQLVEQKLGSAPAPA